MEDCMFDFSFPKRLGVFGTTAGSFPGIRAGPDNKKATVTARRTCLWATYCELSQRANHHLMILFFTHWPRGYVKSCR